MVAWKMLSSREYDYGQLHTQISEQPLSLAQI